jgi:hypothetical protein
MTKENQMGRDGDGVTSKDSGQTLRQRAEAIAREKAFRIRCRQSVKERLSKKSERGENHHGGANCGRGRCGGGHPPPTAPIVLPWD